MTDNEFICPITLQVFHDPVIATDGHTYERKAITQWIRQHGTSPLTRESLRVEDLYSNIDIQKLTDHHRKSISSSSPSIQTIELSNHSYYQTHSTNDPNDSLSNEYTRCYNLKCRNQSWMACILILITSIGILGILFLLVLAAQSFYNRPKISSVNISNYCVSNSHITRLLRLTNVSQFNYTYYSYVYKATSSNNTILFSFQHDSSYWCLDNVSIIHISSNSELIRNGDFEDGIIQPFRFCSKANHSLTNLSYEHFTKDSSSYAFCHRSLSSIDYLFQYVHTEKRQLYNISFWIQNLGESTNKFLVDIIA
ncbi:hypothetical protein I4U23_023897 [Adineta vaga]|nr:hypothetical protein I4U23_023897 [Adineta vaga]